MISIGVLMLPRHRGNT